jgi:F-type H+-transporting ATPase subunit delta
MLSVVESRYARALVDVVMQYNINGAEVLANLREVEQLINNSPELRTVLSSPAVAPSRKEAVMRKLLAPLWLHNQVRNFVYVVIGHRRASEFSSIVDAYEQLLDERLGYVAADIRSAVELNDPQRQAIEQQVTRLSGKKAKLKFSTDPALIGGVVARVGATVYDGSVRGQLERLRTKLSA